MPVVETRGLSKRFRRGDREIRAIVDVDLAIDRGESVAVLGPSGSGKSTLLALLGLLDVPSAGRIRLDGHDVSDLDDGERTRIRRRDVGFVFQSFHLLPTLSAAENVALPGRLAGDPDAPERARDLLEWVGLDGRFDHRPAELSGGERQRVAVARALVNGPTLLLADEPTGNLDRGSGRTLLSEFDRIAGRGVTIVTVTHDPLVADFCDRTVGIADGRVVS